MPKFRSVSIKELLRVGEVDDEELAAALSSIFSRSAHLGGNEVEYRDGDDEWILTLRYKGDLLVDATTGPFFNPDVEAQLRQALAESFDVTSRKIWRAPMFSRRRVEGWYRRGDDYMIRPAPREAPQPDVEYAQHPWLLEFPYADSATFNVWQLRVQRRIYELSLLLNLLLNTPIDAPSNRGHNHWVVTRDADGRTGMGSSQWLQEGYFIPGFNPLADDFSNVNGWSPLVQQPIESYYGGSSPFFEPLAVPVAFDDLSTAFNSLDGSRRSRFLRSCYWLHMFNVVWDYSHSLRLISLINAIECLAQSGEKRLVTDASTKMFVEFMKEYAPGHPNATRINRMYEVRSLVTHGERLLGYDNPRSFTLHPAASSDDEASKEARLLARGAIINWLVRQAGSPANLLAVDPNPKRPPGKPGTKSNVKIITP